MVTHNVTAQLFVPEPGIRTPTLQLQQTKVVSSTDIIEILKRKRKALRAQATCLVGEVEALLRSTTPNVVDVEVLIEHLLMTQPQLNEVNTVIEPLIPEKEADAEFTIIMEYGDKIMTCLTRLKGSVKRSSDRNVGTINSHID